MIYKINQKVITTFHGNDKPLTFSSNKIGIKISKELIDELNKTENIKVAVSR